MCNHNLTTACYFFFSGAFNRFNISFPEGERACILKRSVFPVLHDHSYSVLKHDTDGTDRWYNDMIIEGTRSVEEHAYACPQDAYAVPQYAYIEPEHEIEAREKLIPDDVEIVTQVSIKMHTSTYVAEVMQNHSSTSDTHIEIITEELIPNKDHSVYGSGVRQNHTESNATEAVIADDLKPFRPFSNKDYSTYKSEIIQNHIKSNANTSDVTEAVILNDRESVIAISDKKRYSIVIHTDGAEFIHESNKRDTSTCLCSATGSDQLLSHGSDPSGKRLQLASIPEASVCISTGSCDSDECIHSNNVERNEIIDTVKSYQGYDENVNMVNANAKPIDSRVTVGSTVDSMENSGYELVKSSDSNTVCANKRDFFSISKTKKLCKHVQKRR